MENSRRVLAIVQARMGSTRFPGKVMQAVHGMPVIEILLKRLSRSKRIDEIVLATSDQPGDDELADYVSKVGFGVYRGSENDVLDRYYQAASGLGADAVVRITGDCPLVDPCVVDEVIELFVSSGADYVNNVDPPSFPDGLDAEVFGFQALRTAWAEAKSRYDREHVTPYMRTSDKFRRAHVVNAKDLSAERWTVDEPRDLIVVGRIVAHFTPRLDFTWHEVLELKKTDPEIFAANLGITRNEGATLGSGQKLWKRAVRIIPGGSMLLSKRAEMFLPGKWPAYFSKAKGCRIWDLDGNAFLDMAIMGVGTNTLGYGHPEVDQAVRDVIDKGNMSTFNCPEEVYLAEKLVELHPWAEMVRFARTGGEANAIAVRIARAASGKDKIAFCGYHGWHDWYLAANLASEDGLDAHHISGLEPKGVPRGLEGTVIPFSYNRFDELEALVRDHDIGVIKMEVMRNIEPDEGFLQKIRGLATERNIVLVYDECTSGFRQSFGGIHKCFGVEPDMAVFGKTLGNGYAITAVVGRREIMEAAQSTFISSTFWTERIGAAAGLKTLEVMEKEKSWERITETGKSIQKRWRQLADRYDLGLRISGFPAISVFSFDSPRNLEYKTLITQELLKKGILASNAVYVCTEHDVSALDQYFDALEAVLGKVRQCEDGLNIRKLLEGPVCHSGFRRLN